MLKQFSITIIFLFAIGSIVGLVHAATDDPQVGLKPGQWAKYRVSISHGGDDPKNSPESLVNSLKEQIQEELGFNVDNTIWIKYTVADVSGTVVTFDRSVMLAADPETKDEYILQSLLETLSPEDKISPDILEKVFEQKLESTQYDLAEFEPTYFLAMPTNLEFGSKFDGTPASGEVTFSSIADYSLTGSKSNVFTAHDIITQELRKGIVENTIEFDTVASFYYDQQSGILLERSTDMQITNLNTYGSGWIASDMSIIEYSDDLKLPDVQRSVNDRDEILERLSYFFVESADSRYLITDGIESIGEPKKTTFDIISTKDGSELGALILYGDDKISSVSSSTVFTGLREMNNADDIHIMIRNELVPGCCYPLPTHSNLLMDNIDKGSASAESTFDDVKVELGWVETDPTYKIGIFAQEITFLEENAEKQNDAPKQIQEESKIIEQNSEDIDFTQEKSEETNYGYAALGAFIFLGIPVIIIGLIVRKIKQRRSRRK